MAATLATVAALLKEIYEPGIQDQLNDEVVGMKRIEKTSEGVTNEVGGRYVTFAIRTRRNQGIGARNESEALPTPGQQGNAAARVPLKYLYGGIQLTGQTIALADSNYQAFASALDNEVDGLKTDLRKDLNRQFYGNGSGTLATADTAPDGANTVLVVSTQYLEEGQQIDIIDGTTLGNPTPTVKASNRQITAINQTTRVVTYDGADIAAAAGDVLVRTGSVNREITGLKSIISDTGTLYNVNPTTEPIWKASVLANAGVNRALSEALMVQAVDAVRLKGSKVTVGFTSLGVRRAYFNLLRQERRIVNNTKFEGGFEGLAFTTDQGDVPIIVDNDAPYNQIQFVNEKEIKVYREKDWSWMDRDGSMWQRVITSSGEFDAYSARMYQYMEIGTHRRNAHAVLKDLTEG